MGSEGHKMQISYNLNANRGTRHLSRLILATGERIPTVLYCLQIEDLICMRTNASGEIFDLSTEIMKRRHILLSISKFDN